MKERLIALALCLVFVGVAGATPGVTAAPIDSSAIEQFDLRIGDYVYGKLTIDPDTDEFVVDAYAGKELAGEQVTLVASLKNGARPRYVAIAQSTVNDSGRIHVAGILTAVQLGWIQANGDNAVFLISRNY